MTNKELIEILKTFPENAEIMADVAWDDVGEERMYSYNVDVWYDEEDNTICFDEKLGDTVPEFVIKEDE